MKWNVEWTTFKESGKYYGGDVTTIEIPDEAHLWEIWEAARQQILLKGSMPFMVINHVLGHPHDHPVLLFRNVVVK